MTRALQFAFEDDSSAFHLNHISAAMSRKFAHILKVACHDRALARAQIYSWIIFVCYQTTLSSRILLFTNDGTSIFCFFIPDHSSICLWQLCKILPKSWTTVWFWMIHCSGAILSEWEFNFHSAPLKLKLKRIYLLKPLFSFNHALQLRKLRNRMNFKRFTKVHWFCNLIFHLKEFAVRRCKQT